MPPPKSEVAESAMKAMKLCRPMSSGPRKRAATTDITSTKSCGRMVEATFQKLPRRTEPPVVAAAASAATGPRSVVGEPGGELFIIRAARTCLRLAVAPAAHVMACPTQDRSLVWAGKKVGPQCTGGAGDVAALHRRAQRLGEADPEAVGDRGFEALVLDREGEEGLQFGFGLGRGVPVATVDAVDAGQFGDEDRIGVTGEQQPEIVVLG